MSSKKKLRKQVEAYRRDYEKMCAAYLDTDEQLRDLRGAAARLAHHIITDHYDAVPSTVALRASELRTRFDLKTYEGNTLVIRDAIRRAEQQIKPIREAATAIANAWVDPSRELHRNDTINDREAA